jgi:hypothetical protein
LSLVSGPLPVYDLFVEQFVFEQTHLLTYFKIRKMCFFLKY